MHAIVEHQAQLRRRAPAARQSKHSAGSARPAPYSRSWFAVTLYQPAKTSQWNPPSEAVVCGFTLGVNPGARRRHGHEQAPPARPTATNSVTVASVIGVPLVSTIVPLGSIRVWKRPDEPPSPQPPPRPGKLQVVPPRSLSSSPQSSSFAGGGGGGGGFGGAGRRRRGRRRGRGKGQATVQSRKPGVVVTTRGGQVGPEVRCVGHHDQGTHDRGIRHGNHGGAHSIGRFADSDRRSSIGSAPRDDAVIERWMRSRPWAGAASKEEPV